MSAARSRRRGSKDLPGEDEDPPSEPTPAPEALPALEDAPSAPSAPADGGGGDGEIQEAVSTAWAGLRDTPVVEEAEEEEEDNNNVVQAASESRLRPYTKGDRPSSPATEVMEDNSEDSEDRHSDDPRYELRDQEYQEQIVAAGSPQGNKRSASKASHTSALSDNSNFAYGIQMSRPGSQERERNDEVERFAQTGPKARKAYFLEQWQDDGEEDAQMMEMMESRTQATKYDINELDLDVELKGMVEINSNTMLSVQCFSILWVLGAAAILLALTWHYVWVEVTAQADLAALAAVEHGRLQASEVLSPATAVMKTLDLGFRSGAISEIGDYAGFKRVVEPFFQALPRLRDVEMADTPEYLQYVNPGSVLAARARTGGVELRSDRGDCSLAPGGRGCTLEPLRANGSDWYQTRLPFYPHQWSPFRMAVAWDGPSFARNLPHEAICDELCWSPTYAVAARISGSTDPTFVGLNQTYDGYRSVIARVTMEATIFIDVVNQVQIQSHGEALICTGDGKVVAAVEMADTEKADEETGTVSMVKAWEYPRSWAASVDEGMVAEGTGKSKFSGDYLVSAWRMESPLNSTSTLGTSLRIVVAVPSGAFADSVLQSMRLWFIVTSALPVAFILIAAAVNLYLRFCQRGNREFKDMSVEELKELNRKRRRMTQSRRSRSSLTRSLSSRFSSRLSRAGSFIHVPGSHRHTTGFHDENEALEDEPKRSSSGMMGRLTWMSRKSHKTDSDQKALADV